MKLILCIALFTLCACGQSNGSKSLYSTWVAEEPNWTLQVKHTTIVATYQTGGGCTMDYSLSGNLMTISNATGSSNCSQFDGTWNYQIDGQQMFLCSTKVGYQCITLN